MKYVVFILIIQSIALKAQVNTFDKKNFFYSIYFGGGITPAKVGNNEFNYLNNYKYYDIISSSTVDTVFESNTHISQQGMRRYFNMGLEFQPVKRLCIDLYFGLLKNQLNSEIMWNVGLEYYLKTKNPRLNIPVYISYQFDKALIIPVGVINNYQKNIFINDQVFNYKNTHRKSSRHSSNSVTTYSRDLDLFLGGKSNIIKPGIGLSYTFPQGFGLKAIVGYGFSFDSQWYVRLKQDNQSNTNKVNTPLNNIHTSYKFSGNPNPPEFGGIYINISVFLNRDFLYRK